jgi:lysophospholipase L1-like esterase
VCAFVSKLKKAFKMLKIHTRPSFTLILIALLAAALLNHPVTRAAQPLIVVTLGDSLTQGDGDEHDPPGWPARVETLLQAQHPGAKVINLGQSGWSSTALINGDQGLPGELSRAVALHPNIATVWIGSNDLWYLEGSSDEENLNTFTANIDTIVKTLRDGGTTVLVALLDDQSKRPYALKADVGFTADNRARISRFVGLFNGVIADKARKYGAITVDFFHSTLFITPALLADDGNHPNTTGYDQIAQIWFKAIQSVVTSSAGRNPATSVPTVAASSTTAAVSATQAQIAGCPVFPGDNPWNQDVSTLPVNKKSAAYIANINSGGDTMLHADFGANPDYGIPFEVVASQQALVPINFVEYGDESDPGPYPIPANAKVEGGDDHHVLVIDKDRCRLYELYHAQQTASGWDAGSGAIFDLKSNAVRPETWTSTDEAGLPVFPGLVRYDEVQVGAIQHALRFTVAQTQKAYIFPARHYGSRSDPNAPPMGLRLRLNANFDLSHFSGETKIILTALKKYGMFVADTGTSWFISGATDSHWNDDDLEQLKTVPGTAFEAVETGPVVQYK